MILEKLTKEFINKILLKHKNDEGNLINDKLSFLFDTFSDNTNEYDVLIKVACLNKIYSTSILNLEPVVKKIVEVHKNNRDDFDFIQLVDEISYIKWKNKDGVEFKRNNLSFASKYIHFLSGKETPIYDSYIWILMKGYMNVDKTNFSFQAPKNYSTFYKEFSTFKNRYIELKSFNNYQIDKFLWQYGFDLINEIRLELNCDLNKAKSELQRRIKKNIINNSF